MIRTAVLTISDSCAQGKRDDISGKTIEQLLDKDKFFVEAKAIVPDDYDTIAEKLKHFADELTVDLVLTTGGTGLGPRDVTPEATESVCEKKVPGFGEIARAEGFKITVNAILSRAVAGIRKNTLIINLPGSTKAVTQCIDIFSNIIPHAIEMMRGGGH